MRNDECTTKIWNDLIYKSIFHCNVVTCDLYAKQYVYRSHRNRQRLEELNEQPEQTTNPSPVYATVNKLNGWYFISLLLKFKSSIDCKCQQIDELINNQI